LSREILSYGLFIVLSFIWFETANQEIGYVAGIMGFAACYSIDKVYQVTNKTTRLNIHSASVFLSAMLLTAILANNDLLFYTVIILKSLLYVYRKVYFWIQHQSINFWVSGIRVLIGIVFPMLLMQFRLYDHPYFIFIVIMIGEIIDRVEFYLELDIITPQKQIEHDVANYLNNS
jgi:hypothetical protein